MIGKSTLRWALSILATGAVLFAAAPAQADAFDWSDGAANDDWSDAGNWDQANAPTSANMGADPGQIGFGTGTDTDGEVINFDPAGGSGPGEGSTEFDTLTMDIGATGAYEINDAGNGGLFVFDGDATANSIENDNGNSHALTIDVGIQTTSGGDLSLETTNSGQIQINGQIDLNSNLTTSPSASGGDEITIFGGIVESTAGQGLTTGAGGFPGTTVIDTNSTSFTGATSVQGTGTLQVDVANGLGSTSQVDVAADSTLDINASDAINDAADVNLNGSGAAMDLAGGISDTISALTTASGSGVTLNTGSTLTLNDAANSTFESGTITGDGTLEIDDAGNTLTVDQSDEIGNNTNLAVTNGTVDLNGVGQTIDALSGSGTVQTDAGNTFEIGANGSTSNWGGSITGGGNVNVGADTDFTAENTYTGGTDVFNGVVLDLSAGGATEALSGTSSVDVAANGLVVVSSSPQINDAADVNLNGTGAGLTLSGGADDTISALTTASGANVSLNTTSTLTLTDAANSSFADNTFVLDGTLQIDDAGNTLTVDQGNEIGNDIGLTVTNGTVDLNGVGQTIDALNGTGTVQTDAGNTFEIGNNGGTSNWGGSITGGGNVDVGGTATFTADNTFTGGTDVLGGATLTLNNGGGQALSGTTSVDVASTGHVNVDSAEQINNAANANLNAADAVLDLNANETVDALNGTGEVQTDGGNTFEIGSNGGTSNWDGSITGGGDLVVGGTANFTSDNTYTGATSVNGGATLSLNNGAGEALSGTTSIDVAANGTLTVDSAGQINDAAAVNLNGAGAAFNLNANENGVGSLTTVSGSTVSIGANSLTLHNDGSGSTISGDITGSGTLTTDGTAGGGPTTLDGDAKAFTGTYQTQNGGTVNIGAANILADASDVDLTGGADALNVNNAETIDELDTAAGSTVTLNAALGIGADGNDSTIDGDLAGGSALTVAGGTAAINSDNSATFSGDTTVNNGATVRVGADNALGAGGTLNLNGGSTIGPDDGAAGTTTLNLPNAVNVNGDFTINLPADDNLQFDGDIGIGGLGGGTRAITVSGSDQRATFNGGVTASNGTIAKNGARRLALTTDNSGTQTADWDINNGALRITDGNALGADAINVALDGGRLITDAAGTPDLAHTFGVVSDSTIATTQDARITGTINDGGTGGNLLTKNGAADLILAADNSGHTGGFQVNNGELTVEHAEALGTGNVTMNNAGSTLELDTAGTPDIDNGINADEDFTLTVTQDAEVSGAVADVDGGAAEDISRNGAGRLELSGNSGGFSDTLDLDAATTEISGTFGDGNSVVNVNNGATLIGDSVPGGNAATVGGDLNVNNGGLYSPGTSPGVFNVNGDANLNAGSTTTVERDASVADFLNSPGTGHDQTVVGSDLNVDGNATINVVDTTPAGQLTRVFYPDAASFQAFDVTGAVNNGGPTINDDDDLVSWGLQGDGSLQADRTEYDQVPGAMLNSNQKAVANGLDALAASTPAGAPDIPTPNTTTDEQDAQDLLLQIDSLGQDLINNPTAQNKREYRSVFNGFSPARHGALARTHRRVTQSILDIHSDYMARRQTGTGNGMASLQRQGPQQMMASATQGAELALAEDDRQSTTGAPQPMADPMKRDKRLGGFVQGIGVFVDEDGTDDRVGFNADVGGVLAGLDWQVNEDLIAGVSFAYAASDINFGGAGGEADVDTFRVGPYVTYEPIDRWHIDASVSWGHHEQDTTRPTGFGDAEADVDAQDISVDISTGYDLAKEKDLAIEPIAGVRWVYYDQDEFTESGAGAANLNVEDQQSHSVESSLGVRLAKDYTWAGIKWTPTVSVAWRHEFINDNEDINARFTGAGGSFEIDGGEMDDNALEVGAGLEAQVTEDIAAFGNYTGAFYEDSDHHSVGAGLRIRF